MARIFGVRAFALLLAENSGEHWKFHSTLTLCLTEQTKDVFLFCIHCTKDFQNFVKYLINGKSVDF